jgi:hypothetical protein
MDTFVPKKPKKERTLDYYLQKMDRQRAEKGSISYKTRIVAQAVYARENGVCDQCGSEDLPTADHIVPMFMLNMLGFDMDHEFRLEWLQVLCYPCNVAKGSNIDWSSWRTQHILTRAIAESKLRYETRERAHRQRAVPEVPAPVLVHETSDFEVGYEWDPIRALRWL